MSKIKCKCCHAILVSKHRHDFQSCSCGTFVDGGGDYCRVGWPSGESEDWIEHLPLTWKTADGQELLLEEIKDGHLLNIIAHMEKVHAAMQEQSFLWADNLQGDMAALAFEGMAFMMQESDPGATFQGAGGLGWNHMIDEATKRGLKWKR